MAGILLQNGVGKTVSTGQDMDQGVDLEGEQDMLNGSGPSKMTRSATQAVTVVEITQ